MDESNECDFEHDPLIGCAPHVEQSRAERLDDLDDASRAEST